MFNSAIGRNDSWSTSETRSQSTPLESGTTPLDQIRNSLTTAELLSGNGRRTTDVGDFERDGNASIVRNADGSASVTLDMDYRWNDVIDPNPQYSTDRWKSTIAEIVTLGQADAFDIHIGWSETTVIQLNSSGRVTSISNQE